MDKIKVGHIGLGDIAVMRYLPCYGKNNILLNAICTREKIKLKRFANSLKIRQYYTDYKEMLQKADIDAVVITTPTPSHYQIGIDCIKSGKHVFIEKPLTLSLKEADSMISEATKRRIKFMVLPYDDKKSLDESRFYTQNGYIGDILNFESVLIGNGALHEDWFYQEGAGELNDFAIYPISWITELLGPAKEAIAFSSTKLKERNLANNQKVRNDVEDNSTIMLKWENETLGTIASNWSTNGLGKFLKNKIWRGNSIYYTNIYGTEGLIHCNFVLNHVIIISDKNLEEKDKNSTLWGLKGLKKEWKPSKLSAETWGGVEMLRDFADAILKNKELPTKHGHVRHVIEIIEKLYKSIKTSKVQKLETSF